MGGTAIQENELLSSNFDGGRGDCTACSVTNTLCLRGEVYQAITVKRGSHHYAPKPTAEGWGIR